MLRKGFTLIELLIVITIIAILAGAAIPYVQDYVEDARLAKVRADLDEIKNALLRFELDTGKAWTNTNLTELVGPYLSKALADPWGTPYLICASSSVAFSSGPNRATTYVPNLGGAAAGDSSSDDIAADYRAPLALSRVTYIDANKDGSVSAGDILKVRFTREIKDPTLLVPADFIVDTNGTPSTLTFAAPIVGADDREAFITVTAYGVATFTPGRDTLAVTAGSLNAADKSFYPYDATETVPAVGNRSKSNVVVIKAL
ncbi:MAG: prepilin-type N-terminal cleavage/methylation domain-containing protein [Candidatus Riflebacteria bacterium]|nr:prepilin-type N-terminal cleavage/methylation domain-containing protein [Candidatus Riflebacteria bacterium]